MTLFPAAGSLPALRPWRARSRPFPLSRVSRTGPRPDAALLALGREYDAVWAEYCAVLAENAAADDRYHAMQPPVPEALFARPEDKGFGFPKPNGTPMQVRTLRQ